MSSATANTRYAEPGWTGDFGLTGYYYHYQERSHLDNSFLMRDKGPMYGFYYSFGYHPECMDLRVAMEGFFAWSNSIKYKSNGTGTSKNEKYSTAEWRLLGSYPWQLANCWTVEGYTGYGLRYVFNNGYGTQSSTGHFGYDRESEYNYIPLGVRLIKDLQSDMYLIGHLEYDWFLSGTQISHIAGSVENHQDSGFGARAGADLYIPSNCAYFDYLIGTYIRFWNIKDSTINTSSLGYFTGLEPRNKTYEIGIRFGLVF